MPEFFATINELRKTVKVVKNVSLDVLDPFIKTAKDIYLVRYLGSELITKLESDNLNEDYSKLMELVRLSLGPLAIWLGTAELSVRLSDSGFTVEKKGEEFVPASDKKIESVSDSLEKRGFQYLDKALEFLELNKSKFPEWSRSKYYTLRAGNYIRSAVQFQELGLVDIDYSRLTFETLRPLMSNIEERFITGLIGEDLDTALRSKLDGQQTAVEAKLIAAVRKFVACKTAELYTSHASKRNRTGSEFREYKPLVRPVYADTADTGNFYAEQAAYYLAKVQQTLNKYADDFGIVPVNDAIEFNSDEQHIYFAGA